MKPSNAISPEAFYEGKQVVRQEWFINDGDLVAWARLRVFDDGSADVWEFGQVWGFVNEASARFMIREGHYVDLSQLASMGEKPLCEPPLQQAEATNQPFHFGGDWCTGLSNSPSGK